MKGQCERYEFYRLRVEIGTAVNILRGRYGNKDGHAADGDMVAHDKLAPRLLAARKALQDGLDETVKECIEIANPYGL